MSGELWGSKLQIAHEVTAGTAVSPATRKLYSIDPYLLRTRAPRPRKFMTGSRDNQRAFTLGPQEVSGQIQMPMSSEELLEMMLLSVQGGVDTVGPVLLAGCVQYLDVQTERAH